MKSSNGSIFRVTCHLCGEVTGHGEFPAQRPVTRSFDMRLNKRLSKKSWCWWFETPLRPSWCQCNDISDMLKHSSNFFGFRFWKTITSEVTGFLFAINIWNQLHANYITFCNSYTAAGWRDTEKPASKCKWIPSVICILYCWVQRHFHGNVHRNYFDICWILRYLP